jgi:peptide/nickel transport system substrate-binding protein
MMKQHALCGKHIVHCLLCIVLLMASAATAGTDGKLVVAVGGDAYASSGPRANLGKYPLNANIFEPLTAFDEQFSLQPCLAVSWEHQGGKTWKFTLRQGVRFHDGSPLDAAAVRASLEAQQQAGTLLFAFDKITELDAHSIAITTPQENLILPRILSHPQMGISKAGGQPIGTGPFRFVRHVKDQLLEVSRNEDYWGGKAASAGIVFRFLPDSAARVLAFRAKEADVLAELPWEAAPELRKRKDIVLRSSPVGTYVGLMLSVKGPLADRSVREAISLAIDRPAIIKALWHGYGEARQTLLAPVFLGKAAALLPDTPCDPAQARTLLKGRPLHLTLVSGFPNAEAHGLLPEIIQSQLQAAGMDVRLQKINDTGLYHDLLKAGKGDLWLERGSLNSADLTFLPHLLFHPEGFYPKHLGSPAGGGAFCQRISAARTAAGDAAFREQTALALREIIAEERLFIPIAELPFLLAAQPGVQVPALHPTLLTTDWAAFAKQ